MEHSPNALQALIEARASLRAGQRTPPIIQLSPDPREAAAYAMAVIRGDAEHVSKADALNQLANRIDDLLDTTSDASIDQVAASIPVLELMFISYATQAAQTSNVDRKFRFTKMALQCQSAMTRTVIAVQGLKAQRRGAVAVSIDD